MIFDDKLSLMKMFFESDGHKEDEVVVGRKDVVVIPRAITRDFTTVCATVHEKRGGEVVNMPYSLVVYSSYAELTSHLVKIYPKENVFVRRRIPGVTPTDWK